MSLLPPSEAVDYSSREALMEGLQSHARSCGYAISTRRYNARDQALYLKCDRGGEYRPRHGLTGLNRLRDTGTRLTDCPFSVSANCKDRVWTIKVRNPDHNHEATSSSFSHPIQRRMPPEVRAQVEAMSTSGSKPREILTAIR
jgi:malonate-semialdehyde dehydrogenase (acetylating) / methylmalonate-semialdehyde dehydrogenase